jgi:hypothetical protein
MATTSYLYHTLGLRGYVHRRTEYLNGWFYHHVELHPQKRTCRGCGTRWRDLRMGGRFERTFFALPVGGRPQLVVLRGHRQHCLRCGKTLRVGRSHGKQAVLSADRRSLRDRAVPDH